MTCPKPEFQADFFNDVAAVAIVLIFAKVVAHRSRNGKPNADEPKRWRAFWHVLGVLAAAAAAGAALWATEAGSDAGVFHWFAWGGLIVAGAAFVAEIVIDDVVPAWKR